MLLKSVAIYVRVSTQEQANEGYSIDSQIDRLNSYCKARDWAVHKIYKDAGFSGANIERPALNELMRDIKDKRVNLVLVFKLDRLSRSQKDTLYLIEDVFLKNDVDFVSISENFDTSTAFGRAMIGILSVFAQLEREQIRERTSIGRKERAKSLLKDSKSILSSDDMKKKKAFVQSLINRIDLVDDEIVIHWAFV